MSRGLMTALNTIESGVGVDWKKIKNRLIKAGADQLLIDKAVTATAFSDRHYRVTINNNDAFHELKDYAVPRDKSSRSAASPGGNTHNTRVNGSLLAACGIDDDIPYNYLFMPGREIPRPTKRHGLIIENLECFLNKRDTYTFVQEYCGVSYPATDVEFIMGAGNSISNRLIIPYLAAFEGDVMCLLDVDAGGLQIYANLLSGGLSPDSTSYLVPCDLGERLGASARVAQEKELGRLSALYDLSPTTNRVISAIRYFERTLEQESYRAIR